VGIIRLRAPTILVVVVLFSPSVSAATLTVDPNGGTDFTEIQSAIDASTDNDTVLVKMGQYIVEWPFSDHDPHG
jgi:hypothetical protein